MRADVAGRWLLLASVWSLQFIFMRVAVPVFGVAPVAEGRALFAALFLVPWAVHVARQGIGPLEHWKDHAVVGLVNNVAPFLCFSWAATVLPAGYMAIMNGLVPLWTAMIAVPVLKEPFGWRRALGFILGIAGVALIVNLGPLELTSATLLGTIAAVAGTAMWGWAGVLIKQRYGRMSPMSLAAGSIAFSALAMAPLWTLAPPPAAWTLESALAIVASGLLVSGIGYLPFFTLIRDIGPSRTLTVGLAVPVLGIFWGALFLGEPVTWAMLAGAALVILALALVIRR